MSPTRRIIYEGESALRNADTKKHAMGEMKRASEIRVDAFSGQNMRESRETIQRLTSQLQEMQEQMNSMNDSGESQDNDSNYSGEIVLRSQSTSSDFKLLFHAGPRQTFAN